ncbi:hypothetical protein NADFUDRAFT_46323 [Nadsonia fulvescens var. elongata DSM 6958]|uniref:MFS transporter n=1 Tax=Nadsonia fulvescens var. elongata DSM 6958 TaxID=857566 RepID=A0A1E3PJR8_9ASCO|nr:hypothetical protein NADFUDRAFT_46323 [Nadsonia fulvescens var. elongata DSM 6958]
MAPKQAPSESVITKVISTFVAPEKVSVVWSLTFFAAGVALIASPLMDAMSPQL